MRIVNAPTTSHTILILEESDVLCELLEIILGRSGYRVLTASSPSDAQNTLRESASIDLFLCRSYIADQPMDDLVAEFAEYHPTRSVLYLAAPNDPQSAPIEIEILTAPFSISELRAAVCRALSPRARDELNQQAA
jgi:DNA-binding NtrC family response regulator